MMEEENKKECEKEYEKVPIFKNQDIKENKNNSLFFLKIFTKNVQKLKKQLHCFLKYL